MTDASLKGKIGVAITFGMLLLLSLPATAASQVAIGTDTLMLTSLTHPTLCSGYCFSATYTNNSSANVTAIIFGVVHNLIGQTIYYTTATLHLTPGGSATAFLVMFGNTDATYVDCMNVFAVTPSYVAISTTSTLCFHYY